MWEAAGFGKPKIRRFLQECEHENFITEWSETKISFLSSTFEIHGDKEKLEFMSEYLRKQCNPENQES